MRQLPYLPAAKPHRMSGLSMKSAANPRETSVDSYKNNSCLKTLAGKYIWWKTPDKALAMPERVIAQVMNIGDYADVCLLARQVGDDVLKQVLAQAQAGQFNERSWAYWHYRLDMATLEQVPPLPVRGFT